MMKSNYFKNWDKINLNRSKNFPKMIWLGDESLYEKAIFIKDHNQFMFMINELSCALHTNYKYEQKSIDNSNYN